MKHPKDNWSEWLLALYMIATALLATFLQLYHSGSTTLRSLLSWLGL